PPQHRLLPAPPWSAPCLPRLTGCCTAPSPRTHIPAQAVPPAAPSSRNRQSPISSFTPICFYSRLVCPSEAEGRLAFAPRLFLGRVSFEARHINSQSAASPARRTSPPHPSILSSQSFPPPYAPREYCPAPATAVFPMLRENSECPL